MKSRTGKDLAQNFDASMLIEIAMRLETRADILMESARTAFSRGEEWRSLSDDTDTFVQAAYYLRQIVEGIE